MQNANTTTELHPALTHLHGVDGGLGRGARQRPGDEPLVGPDLPPVTGQQLLVLSGKEQELVK